jgi:hypothetical protein
MTLPPKGAGEAVDEATEELEVPLVTAGEGPVAVAEEGLQMPVAVEGAEEEAEADFKFTIVVPDFLSSIKVFFLSNGFLLQVL